MGVWIEGWTCSTCTFSAGTLAVKRTVVGWIEVHLFVELKLVLYKSEMNVD